MGKRHYYYENQDPDYDAPCCSSAWCHQPCCSCCCSCCSRLCCCVSFVIISIIVLILAAGIGIAIALLFPRMPTVDTKVSSSNIVMNTERRSIDAEIHINLSVNNPNFFSIGIQDLYLDTYYWCSTCFNGTEPPKDRATDGVNIGNVKYMPKITFPRRSNSTGEGLVASLYGNSLSPDQYLKVLHDCSSGAKSLPVRFVGNVTALLMNVKIPRKIPLNFASKIPCS